MAKRNAAESEWQRDYRLKKQAAEAKRTAQHGADWDGEGEVGYEREMFVRDALRDASLELDAKTPARIKKTDRDPNYGMIARAIDKDPGSVRSSLSPPQHPDYGKPDWRRVYVYTENGIGDPYEYGTIPVWERAVEILNEHANSVGHEWGWDSVNAGVQVFTMHAPAIPVTNPNADTRKAAIAKYKEFHRLKPTKIGDFPSSFTIPQRVQLLGDGKHVLYASGKKDPETLRKPRRPVNYIHDHDAGVCIYSSDPKKVTEADTVVPDFIVHAKALVELGTFLGFAWKDGDGEHNAESTGDLPDLYCTVDGRALLVIQSRRHVLAIIWGGALGVEARGIVG